MKLSIRERLSVERRRVGISQEALASTIGVDSQTYSRWERGIIKKIPADKLKDIAVALNKPPAFFLEDTGERAPDLEVRSYSGPEVNTHPKGSYSHNSESGYIPVEAKACANGLEMLKQPSKNEEWVYVPPSIIPHDDTLEYFGVKVDGDCMEPLIPNGSYAVAKKLHHGSLPKDGAIVIVSISKTRKSLKRITYVTGTDKKRLFLLKTINEKYKEDIPIYSDILKHKILGEVEILNINTLDDNGKVVESTFRRI